MMTTDTRAVYLATEFDIQAALIDYIRRQYPDVIYQSDLAGVRLTIGQATKLKRVRYERGWPDVFIAEPRGTWFGLFIELKRHRDDLLTAKGDIRGDKHIGEQSDLLERLRDKNYYATFACGLDEAIEKVDTYMARKATKW